MRKPHSKYIYKTWGWNEETTRKSCLLHEVLTDATYGAVNYCFIPWTLQDMIKPYNNYEEAIITNFLWRWGVKSICDPQHHSVLHLLKFLERMKERHSFEIPSLKTVKSNQHYTYPIGKLLLWSDNPLVELPNIFIPLMIVVLIPGHNQDLAEEVNKL